MNYTLKQITSRDGVHCDRSGVREYISVGEEVARRLRCPLCQRTINIRPTRRVSPLNPNGNPVAMMPRHKPTKDGSYVQTLTCV